MGEGSREDRTVFVRNIDNKVTEEILFDLFLQAGPLVSVKRPTDPDGNCRPFAFVEFEHDVSPPYARSLMDGIKLFGRSMSVQFRSGSRHSQDSRGNSPSAPPTRYSNGSPAQNGSPNFPKPPMVQRSLSATQGFQGAPGMGLGHPMEFPGAGYPASFLPAPLMGNNPVPGFIQGGPGPRPGLMSLIQPPLHPSSGHVDQPVQQLSGHLDNTHQQHHRHPSNKEQRRSDGEQTPRSHHRDSHRHGNGNNGRHDDRYHGDRGHQSEERRHGNMDRHHSQQHHRQERRDHPYRR